MEALGVARESKPLTTLIEPAKKSDDDSQADDLIGTKYRSAAARGNFMSLDWSDVQYAVKELSRHMANPRVSDMARLKRLARYLVDKQRHQVVYKYQSLVYDHGKRTEVLPVVVYTDTDFAGCRETRKSTSGGVAMICQHTVKTWSTIQTVVALSSGEAEYYGMVKGGSQAIGFVNMLCDLGVKVPTSITLRSDASAAIGIASRKNMGRVRHIEVAQLWLQSKNCR